MLKDLHICVQTFKKITDLKHMLVIVLVPEHFIVISLRTYTQLRFSLHFTTTTYKCTVSVEVFRKQVRVMTVRNTAWCFINFLVMDLLFQLWLAFTNVPRCLTKQLLTTTWQPFLFKGNCIWNTPSTVIRLAKVPSLYCN